MTAFSDYLENALLDATVGGVTYTTPGALALSLHTGSPGVDTVGAEVSGGAYARQAVTFGAASGGQSANGALVTFPTATASWGAVTHFGIWDDAGVPNLLYWGSLAVTKNVDNGDIFTVPVGNLTIELD